MGRRHDKRAKRRRAVYNSRFTSIEELERSMLVRSVRNTLFNQHMKSMLHLEDHPEDKDRWYNTLS